MKKIPTHLQQSSTRGFRLLSVNDLFTKHRSVSSITDNSVEQYVLIDKPHVIEQMHLSRWGLFKDVS